MRWIRSKPIDDGVEPAEDCPECGANEYGICDYHLGYEEGWNAAMDRRIETN